MRSRAAWLPNRLVVTVLVTLAAVAVAIPVVAFAIVPIFVRSTLHEPPVSANTPNPAAQAAGVVASPTPMSPALSGELRKIDANHFGRGRVTISGPPGAKILRFEGVDIAGAPNMFVYLSDRTDGQPGRFTDVGALKATNGSFNYSIPAEVDLDRVHSVVVWCRAFSVTVTYAMLSEVSG